MHENGQTLDARVTSDHKIYLKDKKKRIDGVKYADEVSLFKGDITLWHILNLLIMKVKDIHSYGLWLK
jgi:hypothetical protein